MTHHRLPFDFARCPPGIDCPRSGKCLRRLAPGRPGGDQCMSMFPGGSDCHGFIPAKESRNG